MRFVRLIPFIVLAIVGLTLLAFSSGDTAAAQGTNLLVNPGFEGQYSSYVPETPQEAADCPLGVCTTAQMPHGWKPWWIKERSTDVNPEYKPAEFSERVRSGSRASQYFSFWSTHKAGLRQTVTVPENATVTFTVWGFAWMTESDDPGAGSDGRATPNMRVGIDPTGGSNPYSPSIVWSGFQQARDVYALFSVEAQAQGTRVTVFTFSAPDVNPDSPDYGFKHTDVYWDDASLTAGGAAAPPPAPQTVPGSGTTGGTTDTAPAASSSSPFSVPPTSTPDAEGVIYSVVQAGDSIWSIAAKAGITLDEILEYNNLEADDFVSVGDLLIVGYGDPPSAEEPEPETAEEEETEPEPTATPEPVSAETEETTESEEEPTASVCLSAYHDENQNGARDEGEPLRSAVAFTISDVEKVVSNYVTDGASEPFCIEGLAPGNYRITRSVANGEVATTSNDQSLSLEAGEALTFEFGSYQEAEAVAELQSPNRETGEGENAGNNLAGSAIDGEGGGSGIVIIAVVVAVLLLVGVLVVILSARRTTA